MHKAIDMLMWGMRHRAWRVADLRPKSTGTVWIEVGRVRYSYSPRARRGRWYDTSAPEKGHISINAAKQLLRQLNLTLE